MALSGKVRIATTLLIMVTGGGCIFYLNNPESNASTQSTDDAYIAADLTAIAPLISGQVSKVFVTDNQRVSKGDLLASIDDREFIIAVETNKASVASAQANIASINAHLLLQESSISQAEATVSADAAALKLARSNATRYGNLALDGSGTLQAQQQAEAQLAIQIATGQKNEAILLAARQQIGILHAELKKATATLAQAQAALAAAELKFSYTKIAAPLDGVIGARIIQEGAFANAGKPLVVIVPLNNVYITANFRESQLANVRPGQKVEIEIDAFPDATLTGRVESLGPASGVSYSAIEPHNATGNFTKIAQRLPVRISIDKSELVGERLRVGMSVRPVVLIQ